MEENAERRESYGKGRYRLKKLLFDSVRKDGEEIGTYYYSLIAKLQSLPENGLREPEPSTLLKLYCTYLFLTLYGKEIGRESYHSIIAKLQSPPQRSP